MTQKCLRNYGKYDQNDARKPTNSCLRRKRNFKKFQFRKLPNAYSVIIGSYRDTFNTMILAFTVIQINKANQQKDFIYSFIVNVN